MKKSELRKLIKETIREQGPDPVEPNMGATIFPGGIATGPAMGPNTGGGNMATPDKGIENLGANACCGPLKRAIDKYASDILSMDDIQGYINQGPQGDIGLLLPAAATAGRLHDEMQIMFDKCCQGKVDGGTTMTTPPTTYGDKFTGGGNVKPMTPVKGIIPALQGVIDEIKKNRK